jgi:hypothetical protein
MSTHRSPRCKVKTMAVTEVSKRTVDILLYASPLDQTHIKIDRSINRRDKAGNERLPYDYHVGVAVPVGGVREGE